MQCCMKRTLQYNAKKHLAIVKAVAKNLLLEYSLANSEFEDVYKVALFLTDTLSLPANDDKTRRSSNAKSTC